MENGDTPTPSMPKQWFPYTKLQPPRLRTTLVLRNPLQTTLLEAVRQHKLTLIAAPAGSGKTSLATTLAQSHLPLAWATLDPTDDEVPIFCSLLVAVLEPYLQDDGQSLLNFIQTVPNAGEKSAQLAAMLINQWIPADGTPTLLVLDDYHVIENPVIHDMVAYLIEYLPDSLRVVLATRYDPPLPLPRLRTRGQLAEIRLSQLRFDTSDATSFLNQQLNLGLTTGEVAMVLRQTEGWIAGLQLLGAALTSIQDNDKRVRYIQRLGGVNQSIFALLAEEVLGMQSPEVQEFLLQTSILPELTPIICRELTKNPAADSLLMEVYERNLFLNPLSPDSYEGPFVYHQLFGGFLQQRLQKKEPGQWKTLHRRAADLAASPEQALQHFIHAHLWQEAADHLETMVQTDMERRFIRRTLVNSITLLPEAIRLEHPWLLLYVAQFHSMAGHSDIALPWLNQAAERFREMGDEFGELEILVAFVITETLETDEVVNAFRKKMDTIGHLIRPDQKIIYHGAELWHAMATSDWDTLTHHLNHGLTLVRHSHDRSALHMAALILGPHILFNNDGMALPEDYVTHCLQIARRDDWNLRISANVLLGSIRLYQGRVDSAERAGREAYRLLEEIGGELAWIDIHIIWLLLSLALTRRAYHSFDALLTSQASRWENQVTAASYLNGFLYLNGRAMWLRGRVSEAESQLKHLQQNIRVDDSLVEDRVRNHLLSGLVAMAKGDFAIAEQALHIAVKLHERTRHTILLTDPRLSLATLHSRQGRWDVAIDELRTITIDLKKRGMIGVILQEGESIIPLLERAIQQNIERETLQPLLDVLQPADNLQPIPIPDSNAYLTPREVEVLRLLATGITNRAIAEELVITERTVKAHMTRILTKLDATTRTEVVAKATQLGLL